MESFQISAPQTLEAAHNKKSRGERQSVDLSHLENTSVIEEAEERRSVILDEDLERGKKTNMFTSLKCTWISLEFT